MYEGSFEYPVDVVISSVAVYVVRKGSPKSDSDYWVAHVAQLRNIQVIITNAPVHVV